MTRPDLVLIHGWSLHRGVWSPCLDALREVAIAPGLAVGNVRQRAPDLALELRAVRRQRQVEAAAFAGKVVLELAAGLAL